MKAVWPEKAYFSLEDPDVLHFATEDPRGFLEQGSKQGMIIDEAQRLPSLFNYLQGYADSAECGRYIITGSNNYLLMEKISQSLAGRTAILNLLPFSAEEIGLDSLESSWEECAWKGFYPRVRADSLPADVFARDYVSTYVERDARLIKNIGDLSTFRAFIALCAGRTGQLLNLNSLSTDAGISANTVKSWLSVLEASWLIFRLPPWHQNLNKRIVKSPKLYWYDTSLLCHILGIRNPEELKVHSMRGPIFENLLIAERYKNAAHRGIRPELHFWRDSAGREVDLIEGRGSARRIWEFKAGGTIVPEFFKHLDFFGSATGLAPVNRILAYGGVTASARSAGSAIGWKAALEVGPS